MTLVKLKAAEKQDGYFTLSRDDVPDENEWHAIDPFDATACGLAYTEGGTDRSHVSKSGTIKEVTCDTCKTVVSHYRRMKIK